MRFKIKILVLVAGILSSVQFQSAEGATNGVELRQLVKQYLPGCAIQSDPASKPVALVSATGEILDLRTAVRENPQPRPGAGYWFTPTMAFLSKQGMAAGTAEDAAGAIKLLHVIERGPNFVKQKIYNPIPFEGGWVVEVEHDSAKYPGKVPALEPYELLVDSSQHVVQMRQRCFLYRGSARVYGNTIRSVYAREMNLNGGVNYPEMVEKELAKAWETEKAQKTAKPAPGQKK